MVTFSLKLGKCLYFGEKTSGISHLGTVIYLFDGHFHSLQVVFLKNFQEDNLQCLTKLNGKLATALDLSKGYDTLLIRLLCGICDLDDI